MENLFSEGTPKSERIARLEGMAHAIEETVYHRTLTQEELDQRREKLADNEIRLSRLENEKKQFIDLHKIKVKPFADEKIQLLAAIETKQEAIDGILYHIADHEAGIMNSYDEDGVFISSRRLRPDEKQSSIFSISKVQ